MTATSIQHWLNSHGFLLCAFRWDELPNNVSELIALACPKTHISADHNVLLMANAGPKFWQSLQRSPDIDAINPIDCYSIERANAFHHQFLGGGDFARLYPTPEHQGHIPLMRLGGLAQWNLPSPLGLGLHPTYGPWSAYRAAWLTTSKQLPEDFFIEPGSYPTFDLTQLHGSASLCATCDAPCEAACPAGAVQKNEAFNVQRCYDYRAPTDSPCHTHCAARKACPVGAEYQYDDSQLTHHMSMTWRTR